MLRLLEIVLTRVHAHSCLGGVALVVLLELQVVHIVEAFGQVPEACHVSKFGHSWTAQPLIVVLLINQVSKPA